jgi:hypothetical protein
MLQLLQAENEKIKELIVPDSVQKAQLKEAVEKISTLDYESLLTNVVQDSR